MEGILFQAFCSPQNLKENMKFWKADWSDVEFQIRITKYGWHIQSVYFLHRYAKEHWKWVFLNDGVSSLILHCPALFERAVLKRTEPVPVQLIWYIGHRDSSASRSSGFIRCVMTTQQDWSLLCANCSFSLCTPWSRSFVFCIRIRNYVVLSFV